MGQGFRMIEQVIAQLRVAAAPLRGGRRGRMIFNTIAQRNALRARSRCQLVMLHNSARITFAFTH